MTLRLKQTFILMFFALLPFTLSAKNKTWHLIDKKGEITFSIEALSVSDFKNGLARVYKNTLVNNQWITGYGYIDTTGRIVIPCNLKEAKDFNGPVTWVKTSEGAPYQLMDRSGRLIETPAYDNVKNFYPGQRLSAVYRNKKMGFVNEEGKEVIPCIYSGSSMFSEGLSSVTLADDPKGKYGFIDESGKVVIPLQYIQSGTSSFQNGMARASVGGKTVLIDKKGEVAFRTDKGNIQGFSKELICVFTKPDRTAWGFMNLENEFVIKPTYDYARPFNEDGYAIVEKKGLKGIIDTTGKEILPMKYETVYCDVSEDGYFLGAYPSKNGTSLANAQKDYFTKDLIPINLTEMGIKYLKPAKGGQFMVFATHSGTFGFLDRDFNVVIPDRFTRASSFSEGFCWVRTE